MKPKSLILFLLLLLSACSGSKRILAFEVLYPAEFSFPVEVDRVAYINRSPYTKYNFKNLWDKRTDQETLYILDTIVSNSLKNGVLDGTAESGLYYLDSIIIVNLRRTYDAKRSGELSVSEREAIYRNYNVDAMIVVDNFGVYIEESYSGFSSDQNQFYTEFLFSANVQWHIYTRGADSANLSYQQQDTLFFTNYMNTPPGDMVNATSVLRNGFYAFARTFSMKLVPEWIQVERYVFRGGDAVLKKASDFTDKGEWEAALEIWKQLSESKDDRLSAMALHNISVYYELNDDIDTALDFSNKAQEKWKANNTIKLQNLRLMQRSGYMKKIRTQYRITQ